MRKVIKRNIEPKPCACKVVRSECAVGYIEKKIYTIYKNSLQEEFEYVVRVQWSFEFNRLLKKKIT